MLLPRCHRQYFPQTGGNAQLPGVIRPPAHHRATAGDGETIYYVHGPGSTVGLRQAPDGAATLPVDRYRVGMHHVCFEAATHALLDESAARITALGGRITEGPRHFPESVTLVREARQGLS